MQHESIKKKGRGGCDARCRSSLYKGRKDASSGDEAMEKNAKEHGERHDQGNSKVPSVSGKVRMAGLCYDGTIGNGTSLT